MTGRIRKSEETPPSDVNMHDAPPSAQPPESQDAVMEDNIPIQEENEDQDEEESEPQRVNILPGSTDSAASFEFIDEGHTLGNALRYIIMKKYDHNCRSLESCQDQKLTFQSPDVEFCAYAIPHPSEPKMNVRIQTYKGTAVDALKKGLADLQDICDVVADEFWTKRNAYNEQQGIMQ